MAPRLRSLAPWASPALIASEFVENEAALIERVRLGDERAFEWMFRSHYSALCAVAYAFVRSREGAEDIVQNVFRALWARRADWSPYSTVAAYLRTAVRNEALNALRSRRRQEAVAVQAERDGLTPAMGSGPADPEARLVQAERTIAVLDAIGTLAPRCRAVFELKWRDGLTYAQIGDRLGISVKTVEMQMARALKRIRAHVGKTS